MIAAIMVKENAASTVDDSGRGKVMKGGRGAILI